MSSAKPSLDLLRSLTEEHVLRSLMEHARLTRAEVAALTGISKPTISEAVRRLVAAGLVVDTGERSSGRGRSGSYHALSPACGTALVAGISPRGVVVETVDAHGTVVTASEVALEPGAGSVAVEDALSRAVRDALGADPDGAATPTQGTRPVRLAVVSAADPVDRATGRLVHLPDAPFLVGDLDPRSLLARHVDGPVLVDNDVNWAARAEQAASAPGAAGGSGGSGGSGDFVYLFLDEGLGCAVVTDGEVRRGASGLAGEIAHVVTEGQGGRATRLTEVFAQLDLRRPGSTAVDVERLLARVAAADEGDPTLAALGAAVSGVVEAAVALADPGVVVVGGTWGRSVPVVGELGRRAAALPRPVPVVAATVAERPELAGARATALDELRDAVVEGARDPGKVLGPGV